MHAETTAIAPATRTVTTTGGRCEYDYLVISTGYRNKFDTVPGLGPDGYAQTITSLADAERAGIAWTKFLDDPAVGIAAQVPVPWHTAAPVGIPKTGFPVESMAQVAARNIAATESPGM